MLLSAAPGCRSHPPFSSGAKPSGLAFTTRMKGPNQSRRARYGEHRAWIGKCEQSHTRTKCGRLQSRRFKPRRCGARSWIPRIPADAGFDVGHHVSVKLPDRKGHHPQIRDDQMRLAAKDPTIVPRGIEQRNLWPQGGDLGQRLRTRALADDHEPALPDKHSVQPLAEEAKLASDIYSRSRHSQLRSAVAFVVWD